MLGRDFAMKKYKVGIIGYGWAATAHIRAINATDQATVSAVWSSRELDSAELSSSYGSDITTYTNLNTMLKSDIDIVSICSYPNQHANQTVAAARAGKHIIVEKPLCMTLRDMRRMQRAVKKARVKTCVCFEARYSSQAR